MGLLDDTYWQEVEQRVQQRVTTSPAPTPQATQTSQPALSRSVARQPGEDRQTFFNRRAQTIVQDNKISEEEQIKRYGGVIGSKEYWDKKSQANPYFSVGKRLGPYAAAGAAIGLVGGPVGVAVGTLIGAGIGAASFPDQDEEWDGLTTKGKISYLNNSGVHAATNMVAALPKELVRAPVRAGVSVAQPGWQLLTEGKISIEELREKEAISVIGLGKVPTYYQSYQEAIDAGHGPLAAALNTGGTALGDAVMVVSLAQAAKAAFQPRGKLPQSPGILRKGETAEDGFAPVSISKEGKARLAELEVKSKGNKAAGLEGQFLTPTEQAELAGLRAAGQATKKQTVIRNELGEVDRIIDESGKLIHGENPYATDIKNIEPVRQLVQRDGTGRATRVARSGEGSASEYYTLPKSTAKEFGGGTGNTFFKVTKASPDSVELSVVQTRGGLVQRGVDALKREKRYDGDFGPEVKIQSQVIQLTDDGAKSLRTAVDDSRPPSIPGSVTKGMENKAITADQLDNLGRLGEANGLAPQVRDAVIRSVTGKTVMGEMSQAQYVQAAQTLGLFNGANKYVPKEPFLNPASQYLSPTRRWMRNYEERGGMPVYSEGYVPMENAVRSRDVFRNVWRGKSRDLFGDYAKPGRSAERQAIFEYMQGNKQAVVGNSAFDDAVQADLVRVADGLRQMYDEVGPQMDVPPDIFLENYQPHIQNTGGVFTLYKEGSTQPKAIDFFAKFKRTEGAGAPLIDDSLALFDIYVNAGSNSKFVSPTLEKVGALGESLPGTVQNSLKSYVQEKLGYAGRMEQAMDEMVPAINRKLGINLPPDTSRQLGDAILSTQYAGLLSQPATWFRQMFQYPLLGYSRLGPEFAGKAYAWALTKEGMKELADKGLTIDTSYPYGGSLANETTLAGNAVSRYKSVTQKVITPNSAADNLQRGVVYHQFKMQFDNAAQLYNEGRISWTDFEKRIGMQKFSQVDQNIARQNIASGNTEGAFDHLVRDVIDETQFPYRKASTMRFGYGFGGKVATSLLQWPVEAAHTVTGWFKTGQWDNIVRYAASSTVMKRSLEESFGVDFTRSLFFGPLMPESLVAPIPQLAGQLYSMAYNSPVARILNNSGSRKKFNDAQDEVMRTLNAIGYPGALQARNINDFRKAVSEGPGKDGKYAVRNQQGDVIFKTDFSGLFWGELMGFPTEERVAGSEFLGAAYDAREKQTEVKEKVMELYQQEKYKEAADLAAQFGVSVTARDFDDYYIPLTDRTFQALPATLKQQLLPQYRELQEVQSRP